ncbi:recombinase family protein [Rathayibacter festucae]|uniref:recombinase family protein n=1 Tax=Rathayibacter festucae TaxID=110937 RepID=UPI002A69EE8A|nr:recombinase family protein [Rathayibacter festucae]MDY0911317.1 recombinase family protein [Rathayibacter festucae]
MTTPTPAARLIGYARISTARQDEALQLEALHGAGVDERDIYIDRGVSGSMTSRPQLDAMLTYLREGDTVVVFKLDRLGRNTGHVITMVHNLRERGVHVRSISDGLDSATTMGSAMMGILAVFAQVEREFLIERTNAGLAVARAAGRTGGRPAKLDAKTIASAQKLIDSGDSAVHVAKTFGVSRSTLNRALAK